MNPWLNGMHELDRAPILAVGWALIWFPGQGVLIGLIAASLLRMARRKSADLRYGIACLGLIAMAACPVVTWLRLTTEWRERSVAIFVPDRRPSRAIAVVPPAHDPAISDLGIATLRVDEPTETFRSGPSIVPTQPRWRERIERALPAVVAVWLLGVAGMALRLVLGFVEVRGLTRRGISPLPDDLRVLVDRLAERSGLHRHVSWLLSQRVETPAVVGWLRPTVLIPLHRMAHLTVRQLEAVLAHELAHIRRHDYLVNVCQVAVETVLFFHPAVWWVSRRIRIERENCCDDSAAALCGDRLLVARALFALEERRSAPILRVAADGASLMDRVRRLALPAPDPRRPAEVGWIGGGLIAGALGVVAALWLAGPTQARDDNPPKPAQATVRGRVIDETGRPVAGARVRLYRRDSRWERRNPVIEEAKVGTDGEFRLTTVLNPRAISETRGLAPYVIIADHPGKAVGWRIVPINAAAFEGDITLTPPTSRTIRVVDPQGHPVSGAKVVVNSLGDQSSSADHFRQLLEIHPAEGPLATLTDETGHARFDQLPKTGIVFLASKSGLAETYAFGKQETIRLTPSASLAGKVTGPDGAPLAGIRVVLHPDFMWDFEYALTDTDGRYRFDDLRAKGWDMGAWRSGQVGDGRYKMWLQDDRFAMQTQSLALEPGTDRTLDIRAQKAGVIRVSLVEEGTDRPVAGVRIWGMDRETGSSARFNAYTDARGVATFYSAPGSVQLSWVGPPEGVYIRGDMGSKPGHQASIDFRGGETEVKLTMPPIAGQIVDVPGVCTLPGGAPARNASIYAAGGRFQTSETSSYIRERRTDDAGRFRMEGVPGGERIFVYAESEDRKLAGVYDFKSHPKPDPRFRINVRLGPTVDVERILKDRRGRPLASKKFRVVPKAGEEEFAWNAQALESDPEGRIRFRGVVPGLSYHIQEQLPPGGGGFAVVAGQPPPWYDENVILSPEDKE